MRTRGPILTLLSVVCLAIVILALNMTVARDRASEPADAAASSAERGSAPPGPDRPPAPVAATFPTHGTYSGKTSGRKAGEATVAISVRDGQATAYLCDNKKLEYWLEGPVNGASMTLRGSGSAELTAQLADGKLTGTASVGGASWPFSAVPGDGAAPARPNAASRAGESSTGYPAGYAASGASR